MAEAEAYARATGGSVSVTNNLDEALTGSRVIYTKAWGPATTSGLGPESVKQFPEWMTRRAHMEKAAKDAIFMHCLPAYRGHEVSESVLEGPQSVIFDEAENRLHAQKGVLAWCFGVD